MIRKGMLVALTLLVFGIGALRCAAVPVSTIHSAPPLANLMETQDDLSPASVIVRGFFVNAPLGLDVLDRRAEVVFDN